MRTLLRRLAWTFVVVFVVFQIFRPTRENAIEMPGAAIEAHIMLTEEAHDVFSRACRDCHSDRTVWPWYSNVAPVSWFVAGHVNHARRHMNVSRWVDYNASHAAKFLDEMCDLARRREMPLASYRLMHPEARLDEEEIEALCRWTQAARRALIDQETAAAATEGPPSR